MSELKPLDGLENGAAAEETENSPQTVETVKKVTKKGTTVKIIIKKPTVPDTAELPEEPEDEADDGIELLKKPERNIDSPSAVKKPSLKPVDPAAERRRKAEEERIRLAAEKEERKKAEAEKRKAEREAEEKAYAERMEKALSAEHERFRINGRTGADAYNNLFSREYCKRKKTDAKPAAVSVQEIVQKRTETPSLTSEKTRADILLERAAKKASEGTGFLRKKATKLYKKLPESAQKKCSAFLSLWRSFAAKPVVMLCSKLLLVLAVIVIFGISATYATGVKALSKGNIFADMCRSYDVMKNYSPTGDIPEETTARAAVSASDISKTDTVSLSDILFVSPSDSSLYTGSKLTDSQKLSLLHSAGQNQSAARKYGVKLYTVIEAGTAELSPYAYSAGKGVKLSFLAPPTREQLDTVGCHILKLDADGKAVNVVLIVRDTTAPVASLKDVSVWTGDKVSPEMFIDSVSETSPVIASYVGAEPNMSLIGEQRVFINVSDVYGNSDDELLSAVLTIMTDTEAPVIHGAKNRAIVIGDAVSYKEGITVTDNRDKPEDIILRVNNDDVKPNEAGTYKVIYTATDKTGNVSSVEVTFRFGKEDELNTDIELEKYVTKVANSIFKEGMSDAKKVRAIYDWCRAHIGYSGHSTKDNYKAAAVRGFKNRAGDCYTYFACSKALFEYCGIQNKDVVKVKVSSSESSHYWSLVDIGSGWYHFDSTPRKGGFNGFMLTDKQLSDYSGKHKNSHRYDTSAYPATPKAKFSD